MDDIYIALTNENNNWKILVDNLIKLQSIVLGEAFTYSIFLNCLNKLKISIASHVITTFFFNNITSLAIKSTFCSM